MTYELKDWLNSINLTKENLLEADPTSKKSYPPYIINRCLSGHLDCVLLVNEMNKYHFLDKDLQYSFYLNTVRKRKRFSPWLRNCLLYTSPSPRDVEESRMPSSA